MPVYEEKLISPLALRFTQEHIKTSFQDGRIVEDTVAEIEAHPADTDDYDLVLSVPFPEIEIIRWGQSQRESGSAGHWFTLDNRRLYCLQRAAIQHWPLRVAVKVDILYADPGAVKKKYDSTTLGESVTVSHSCKEAALFRWDWRREVPADLSVAWKAVARDDQKMTVDALSDAASGGCSALARMLAFEQAQENSERVGRVSGGGGRTCGKTERSATPSTVATEDDESEGVRPDPQAAGRRRGTPRGCRNSGGRDEHGHSSAAQAAQHRNALITQALTEITRQLQAPAFGGKLRLSDWKVRYGPYLGPLRKFLESKPEVCTLSYEDDGSFWVWRAETTTAKSDCVLAEQAVAEIRKQLDPHGDAGSIRIWDWSGRYGSTLGSFPAFVRSRPDVFVVLPGAGRNFKVAVAGSGRLQKSAV